MLDMVSEALNEEVLMEEVLRLREENQILRERDNRAHERERKLREFQQMKSKEYRDTLACLTNEFRDLWNSYVNHLSSMADSSNWDEDPGTYADAMEYVLEAAMEMSEDPKAERLMGGTSYMHQAKRVMEEVLEELHTYKTMCFVESISGNGDPKKARNRAHSVGFKMDRLKDVIKKLEGHT